MTQLDKIALEKLYSRAKALTGDIRAARDCWQQKLDALAAVDCASADFSDTEDQFNALTEALEAAALADSYLANLADYENFKNKILKNI